VRKAAAAVLDRAHAVLERRAQVGAADLDQDGLVAEGQLGLDVAPGQHGAGLVGAIGPDAAAIGERDVGADRLAYRIGHQVRERGFLRAHGDAPGIQRHIGPADLDVELG
jgi:hypothetical protein